MPVKSRCSKRSSEADSVRGLRCEKAHIQAHAECFVVVALSAMGPSELE